MASSQQRVVSPYPHRLGGHCGSGAMRDLLEWAGLGWNGPPDEGLVFALSGSLDLAYVRDTELMPPIYLVGRGGDLETDLPMRLGAAVSVHATDDPSEGWAWVRDSIQRGRPALVWADIAELPYLRVQLQMSRHDIVVIGYDDEHQIAHVVDNDREDVQMVPYDALAKARSSQGFPVPTRHTFFDIEWPQKLPDLTVASRAAFAQAAAAMTASDGPSIVSGSDTAVGATGLAAVDLFADDLPRWPEVFPDDVLHLLLLGLRAFVEKAGTGGGLFRKLLASGAHDIARLTDDSAAAAVSDSARRCAATWSQVASLARSNGAPARERAREAARVAATLPKLERELVRALEAAGAATNTRAVVW
ncbi:BtrH N-terminal domain-containing protein [Rhodococcus sp. D-46]|nr:MULTISPECIES: BtrH N-terminal domain-containing protein [Rhodococcus]NHE68920.1 BtrH N-terminal domain-containing protein [Rhodococcus sp. D-46]MBS2993627.1 BtrH N-terminal domain-containing protein [Rhodococcus erythropolis]MBW0282374.1 PRTRC system protein E [Rhodococcus sp. FH8]MBW0288659.1 PRTRC system protein E [Rhodococcus sp. MH15]MCD2136265.1 BtrH N-terminal domain-containing protein [Rhodococcus qingshengii]